MNIECTSTNSRTSAFVTFPPAGSSESSRQFALWDNLDSIHKVLLSTDGTLTILLTAFLGEEISLTHQTQEIFFKSHCPQLDTSPDERILKRRVILSTSETNRQLVYCDSEIAIDRIDPEIRDRLLRDKESIGRIIRSAQMETFRQMISWGVRDVSDNPEILKYFDESSMLYRTYSITMGGRPSMIITEYFSHRLLHSLFLLRK